jgi:hypothetical protein
MDRKESIISENEEEAAFIVTSKESEETASESPKKPKKKRKKQHSTSDRISVDHLDSPLLQSQPSPAVFDPNADANNPPVSEPTIMSPKLSLSPLSPILRNWVRYPFKGFATDSFTSPTKTRESAPVSRNEINNKVPQHASFTSLPAGSTTDVGCCPKPPKVRAYHVRALVSAFLICWAKVISFSFFCFS